MAEFEQDLDASGADRARSSGEEGAEKGGGGGPEAARRGPAGSRQPYKPGSMVTARSGDFCGLRGRCVDVQVDVAMRYQPGFSIVGLPGRSTRESRDRIRAALYNSGFRFPYQKRVLVNLAPAAEQKEGGGFDLAVGVGILLASGEVRLAQDWTPWLRVSPRLAFLGELGLQGELRPVRGALVVADALRQQGVKWLFAPQENAPEASLVEGLRVVGARSLPEVVGILEGRLQAPAQPREHRPDRDSDRDSGDRAHRCQPRAGVAQKRDRAGLSPRGPGVADFAEVRGQEATKRGLLIAAAGGHNVLLIGPPGVGKTMLARRVPGILPPMSYEQAIAVTRVQSVVSGASSHGLVRERPFRSPHHTVSYAGLVGGGSRIHPGEVTRAHCGVLFLDELPEFQRRALEALREPLEERCITICRGSGSVTYPADFLLLGAMNPCPCGYLGHSSRPCSCTPHAIRGYREKISGPLLDRLDLFLEVGPVAPGEIVSAASHAPCLDTETLGRRVLNARERQRRRWGGAMTNALVPFARLLKEGGLPRRVIERLATWTARLDLSARAFVRCLRLARTIADVDGASAVGQEHVEEALHYRAPPEEAR